MRRKPAKARAALPARRLPVLLSLARLLLLTPAAAPPAEVVVAVVARNDMREAFCRIVLRVVK
jgi:hypothetical protein